MSIPGLGQIPDQPAATSTTRTISLRPGCEYHFAAPLSSSSPLTIRLLSGTAEKDGTELAPGHVYTFTALRAQIVTWQGCDLELSGRAESENVKNYNSPGENPRSVWVNLHAKLQDLRETAGREGREGPRVLVAGGKTRVGKTICARTLTSYATRRGEQPLVVNTDPKDGMLTLPGSLSAAVFATVMDIEAADGWGTTPASGPSAVPVKLPLAYSLGRKTWAGEGGGEDTMCKELVSRLAGRVSKRLSEDQDVKRAGVILDTAGNEGASDVEMLGHIVDEFSVNIVLALGSPSLASILSQKFSGEKTSLGEPVQVIPLEGLTGGGLAATEEEEEQWTQHTRERAIKEYFFGGSRRTLSPQIQQVDFDAISVYRYGDSPGSPLMRVEPSSEIEHWTLAVMYASTRDAPDVVRGASVMGYVYVSEVDEERRKVRVLAPVGGRLGDRPLVMGKWPEPFISLLG